MSRFAFHHFGDPAGPRRHGHHTVGQEHGLRDAVGDEDHGAPAPLRPARRQPARPPFPYLRVLEALRQDVLALRTRQVRASAKSVVMASDLWVSWNRLPGPVVLVDHAASIFRLRTDAPSGIMTGPGSLEKDPPSAGTSPASYRC